MMAIMTRIMLQSAQNPFASNLDRSQEGFIWLVVTSLALCAILAGAYFRATHPRGFIRRKTKIVHIYRGKPYKARDGSFWCTETAVVETSGKHRYEIEHYVRPEEGRSFPETGTSISVFVPAPHADGMRRAKEPNHAYLTALFSGFLLSAVIFAYSIVQFIGG